MKLVPVTVSLMLFIASGVALYFSHPALGNDPDPFRFMSILGLIVFGIALLYYLHRLTED